MYKLSDFKQDVSQLKSLVKYLERSLKRNDQVRSPDIFRAETLWSKINGSAWLATGLTYYEYCDLKSATDKIIEDGKRKIKEEESLQVNSSPVPCIEAIEKTVESPEESIETNKGPSTDNLDFEEKNLGFGF